MLVKSRKKTDHIDHLEKVFSVLDKYNLKLNPSKFVFRVLARRFLGFLVSKRVVKADLDQIRAIQDMRFPQSRKDVQALNEILVALNQFVLK